MSLSSGYGGGYGGGYGCGYPAYGGYGAPPPPQMPPPRASPYQHYLDDNDMDYSPRYRTRYADVDGEPSSSKNGAVCLDEEDDFGGLERPPPRRQPRGAKLLPPRRQPR